MVCPWLEKTNEGSYCTSETPKIELDFSKPSKPNVNGEICKMPKPNFVTTIPWEKCERYKPTKL
jgi:hypothetical protein